MVQSSLYKMFNEDDQFLLTLWHRHCRSHYNKNIKCSSNSGADMAIVAFLKEKSKILVWFHRIWWQVDEILSPNETDKSNYIVAGTFLPNGKIFNYLNQGVSFNDCFNHHFWWKNCSCIWNDTLIDEDYGMYWVLFYAKKLNVSHISSNVEISENEINGPVIIEDGVKILNGTVINGPAHIGENALLEITHSLEIIHQFKIMLKLNGS